MAVSERLILEGWKNCSFDMELLVTHRDGTALSKLYVFFLALFNFAYRLVFTDVSIVYIHFSIGASFYRKSVFTLFAKIFGRKVVLHCRTGEFEVFYRKNLSIIKKYIKYILNLADGIIVLGNSERDFFVKLCDDKFCKVIYNSIICPSSSATLDKLPMIVCTMGTLGQRKGSYDLLKAIPFVLKEYPKTEFWLCGNGEVEKCNRIIKNIGVDQNVKLLGWVSENKKEEIYKNSSIYVLPSYYEGMPRSILEAMSYGLPVIATSVNAVPDLVEDGKTGILIQPGDIDALANNIITLLRNIQDRINLGQAARLSILNNFNVEDKLRELEDVFNDVIKQV